MKWQAAGRFGGSIKDSDWLLLKEFFEKRKIKKVVEFGPGRSTILMDAMGISVVSYETKLKYAERILPFLKRSVIIEWDGIDTKIPINTDFVFIDGPESGESRECAYEIAAWDSKVPFVGCHDYQREYETRWRNKFMNGWPCLAKGEFTAVYERVLPKS